MALQCHFLLKGVTLEILLLYVNIGVEDLTRSQSCSLVRVMSLATMTCELFSGILV
jgi:hypothetical protein